MSSWNALVFEVPDEGLDDWVACAGHDSLGLTVESVGAGRSRLRVYFADGDEAAAAADRLRAAGVSVPGAERVEDGRWVERYQEGLRPFPLGEGFEVQPAGPAPVAAGRRPLVLVPGRAFGTGEHPTTRLCVRLLERHVVPGGSWLDLGCGSAILALVARLCGAREVLAVDVDPAAVEVAGETLRANEIDGVTVACGSLPLEDRRRFDGVVCNIALGFFVQGASLLGEALVPDGRLIATGFLTADEAEATRMLERTGLRVTERLREGEWLALIARNPVPR